MKKIVLALTVALLGTIMMNAQPARPRMSSEDMVKERVERLNKALNLTEEQKAEITKIYTEEMDNMMKNRPEKKMEGEKPQRPDVTMDGEKLQRPDRQKMEARHKQMKAQRDATNAKIEQVLSPEQVTKFAEIKDKMDRPRHGGKGHGPRDGKKCQQDGGQACDCKAKSE